MFGRRFAHRFSRDDWEGWTPPWLEHDWEGPRGPHFFHGYPQHGFFGHRGPSGPGWQWSSPEFQALWSEAAEVARLFAIASRTAFDNLERLRDRRPRFPEEPFALEHAGYYSRAMTTLVTGARARS